MLFLEMKKSNSPGWNKGMRKETNKFGFSIAIFGKSQTTLLEAQGRCFSVCWVLTNFFLEFQDFILFVMHGNQECIILAKRKDAFSLKPLISTSKYCLNLPLTRLSKILRKIRFKCVLAKQEGLAEAYRIGRSHWKLSKISFNVA